MSSTASKKQSSTGYKKTKTSYPSSASTLTPRQTSLYWREWAKARKMFIDTMGMDPKDADAERMAVHADELGSRVSSKQLKNKQLDKVLAAFRAISSPADTDAQINAIEQPLKRLRWKIEQIKRKLGMSDQYLDGCCVKINHCHYTSANEHQLKKLLIAIEKHAKRQS